MPFILFAALLTGCGSSAPEGPPVYKVTGLVKFLNGKPFPGGIITFTLQSDPSLTMSGEIADDGTFSLATVQNSQRLNGAMEGDYQVMVSARFSADAGGVNIYKLSQTYKIEPRDNQLTIEVDPATATH
jgi:hypothetical protein